MTSSPGSTVAIIAAIIPSVEPHVTVISASGSISKPRYHFVFFAIASRKSFAPQVIAYWFTSSAIACIATRLMSSGAAKSGKPCERFTAPYFIASRVISRMTDSVKRLALREMRRDEIAGELMKLATDEHELEQIRTRDYVIARLLSIRVIDPPAAAGGTDYLSVSIRAYRRL